MRRALGWPTTIAGAYLVAVGLIRLLTGVSWGEAFALAIVVALMLPILGLSRLISTKKE